MRFLSGSVVALGLVAPALAYPRPIGGKRGSPNPTRAAAVKAAFQTSWNAYHQYAFPHDDLHPVSNTYDDERNGWGSSAVDGLDTAILMGDADIVNTILKRIPQINFTTTAVANQGISVFETNIRYIGGMLASYDLLKGPFSYLVRDQTLVKNLLTQAESLANGLKVSFNTTSGVPDPTVYFNPTYRNSGTGSNNVAEIGTLVLEWTHLSDLTGNPLYGQLAQKGESYLLNPTGSPEAWPGLVGTYVSTSNGQFQDSDGSWSALSDSFYEYLIKMYLYDPHTFGEYKDRWVLAADSTIAHLASHPTSRQDLTFLSQYSGQTTSPQSGHLASFAGGNFILGGILLGEQKYIDFGIELTDSYFDTYNQTASGIGPEGFQWVDSANSSSSQPPSSVAGFYSKAGFWVTAPYYILRPETLESIYYSYRITGDAKYQDMAWEAISSILSKCRAGSAYSSINDVTQANGGGASDDMESFWFAEVLKYAYLIFAEESDVQLKPSGNKFVFNTEAHPFRIRH
ncbi:mannosyl-oligosaccharide alpha-1,2-mannosidase 1B [Trichoderma asperellum]|uniref:alpha-1,2-Mannosidase n=1 Tax=Trichoderma asperellum TaxID=101201 RepID=A0A6V8QK39_TRIAP|nr:glycoside hydrolase family 47 protein [Trichoderma asperelloides]GFP52795.1 mannosyl-oligosaccharide alpha-1,2-mannosidase 1B [Trichoderma asperellum]